jgi:hypothetical protein
VKGSEEGLRCSVCHRAPRADESPADEWRAHADGLGEVRVVCPECAARELGPHDPYEQLRSELAERLDRDARPLWRRVLGL